MIRTVIRPTLLAAALAAVGTAASAALPKAAVTDSYDDLAPYAQRADIVCTNNRGAVQFTVPSNARLVIDYVSTNVTLPANGNATFLVASYLNGFEVEAHIPTVPQGIVLGTVVFAASAPMKMYADPNTVVTAVILSSTPDCGGIVGLVGHLVPVN